MHESTSRRSYRNVIAGLIFVAIAAAYATGSLNYPLGTPLRMGPGFMPLLLAGILGVLGAVIVVSGLRSHETVQPTPIAWRGIVLILLALVIFGTFARQLGLLPLVFICTTLTALASRSNTIVQALVIAASMTLLCWLIFRLGLSITLPDFGTLFTRRG